MQDCAQAALPQVFLQDSFLWLTSSIHCSFYVTVFSQPLEARIQNTTHELLLWAQICSEDSQQLELLYSKVTCKAFWISATASLVWLFLQPSNNSARHIVFIFCRKFANRSWQNFPLPTVAHKTLCFTENDTANATWDGRLQTELHLL